MYHSTRDQQHVVSGAQAILQGIADDGGLFVPEKFENLSDLIQERSPYHKLCERILESFFPQLSFGEEIKEAYDRFAVPDAARVSSVQDLFVLELYHGPTAAFKDFALQILPILIKKSKQQLGNDKRTLILTATSGDTGKAALEGFANVDGVDSGIDIAVLYPSEGVSHVQKRQMMTQEGKNVQVFGIEGDFDAAQRAVKQAFLNEGLKRDLEKWGIEFSSANSINIGRLVPQIAYYFYSYQDLLQKAVIVQGEAVDFCVPTGNFGDILAGYYAKQMGLPIGNLICASNENKVLKEFFETGIYDRRRALILTSSPSMDIVVSSNLERFLFHCLKDTRAVRDYMRQLEENGFYQLSEEHFEKVKRSGIVADYSKSPQAHQAIRELLEESGYLMDTHTAIAWNVARKKKSKNKMVVLSTASAYKFAPDVARAIGLEFSDEENAMEVLSEHTGVEIPQNLKKVMKQQVIHQEVIQVEDFAERLLSCQSNRRMSIRVPATSANMGPGFDVLGVAVCLFAEFEVEVKELSSDRPPEDIRLELFGVEPEFQNKENLFYKSYRYAAERIGSSLVPKTLTIKVHSEIPVSRGLGSSSAFIVGGVMLAFELSKRPYTKAEVLEVANAIEGHPDNVAPAIFGGLRASMQEGERAYSMPLPIFDDLHFVAIVPEERFSTQKAREVLPKEVPFRDAVFNLSRLAMLIAGFCNRDYSMLRLSLEDRLHQAFRLPHMPHSEDILQRAGDAQGYYVSGAGSTIMILDESYEKVQNQFEGCSYKVLHLKVDPDGAKIK